MENFGLNQQYPSLGVGALIVAPKATSQGVIHFYFISIITQRGKPGYVRGLHEGLTFADGVA